LGKLPNHRDRAPLPSWARAHPAWVEDPAPL
jgi:hypothetical protein